METEGSLPYSQDPENESDDSNPYRHILFPSSSF